MLTDDKYEYIEYESKRNGGKLVRERLGDKGELLALCKRTTNNCRFYYVKFNDCGHKCFIAEGKPLQCNHKDCKFERVSKIQREVHNRPEVKEKHRKIAIEVNARPEVREKHRKIFSEYWSKEENRQHMSQKTAAYFSDPENRKAQSERRKEYFSDENNKIKSAGYLRKWYAEASEEEKNEINERRKQTMNTPEFKEQFSVMKKTLYADREHKQNYLEGRVRYQRAKENSHEVRFMEILDEKGIDYVWQVPLLTENNKGYVLDFYLPEFDIYVNIDGSIHGTKGKKEVTYIEGIKENDRQLDAYCQEHNINLVHIRVSDMQCSDFNLKGAIGV